ncbi:armadillo-like helical domain-containing protein 4 [Oryctolagus cuniculus]|uniref:armadillo-like helical domain-containing protein 4 n=1 Tax=Oryctolagus cuniculus TaxID=9986 RepID=UPI00222F5928|nr:armadillo-like helical domain-containing protein 4 [Oryctolagus cuniculus]
MNKQRSPAPSPRRPRQRRESPPPLQGPRRRCGAPALPLSSARCSAEGAQDSIIGIVSSANLGAHFSSTMSKPIVLHIYLACCSLLLLSFATQCLAFPKIASREIAQVPAGEVQSEGMDADDLENSSVASQKTPRLTVSKDPMIALEGPSAATPLHQIFSIHKETHPTEAGVLQPNSPGVYIVTEPGIPAGEEVSGSSQPARVSPGSRPPKAMSPTAVMVTGSPKTDEKEEPFSRTGIQATVEGTPAATQGFLRDMVSPSFAMESQGHSPLSHVTVKDMLTTHPRAEELEADADDRTTSFPSVKSAASTEPGSLTPDREKPSQLTADNTQATATKSSLATSEDTLSVEPDAASLPGAWDVAMSVSTAVPSAFVSSDEWDDTKLESASQMRTPKLGDDTESQVGMGTSQTVQVSPGASQIRTPKLGDDTESQVGMGTSQTVQVSPGASQVRTPKLGDDTETKVGMGTSQTAQASPGGLDRGYAFTEATEGAQGLPEGETHLGTALPVAPGDERSPAFIGPSSSTPTSLLEDTRASAVNLFPSAGDFPEPTQENDVTLFSETTVSVSEYESEAYQPLRNTLKDITQETTTATQEPEAPLSLVTQEEVPGGSDEPEEAQESPAPGSDVPGVTELSGRWEPLATTVSTTAVPLSVDVTPAAEDLMDTVTRPNEEFTPVLDSPVTTPGLWVGAPSTSLALPASEAAVETRTVVPSISRGNTAASYGLDQLESEEGDEDEDEEDEDEDEEEEEDEEEDDEDKDTDALDESLDGDTELPGFTVPGVTSQEPGFAQDNVGPLEGATYQMPDAIEWEQQNQGLVRSWMEKLKDKAGYMSGMLVPVGVGIAGALFILGALYSIKVMNRRRRNGFKRHKRKQREFNSMQDRVMLLADSSEDEF